MALLSWLFPSAKERQSKDVLQKCEASIKSLQRARMIIDSGMTQLDKALQCQPIISTLNLICGRNGDERFKAVEVRLLLVSAAKLQQVGQLHTMARTLRAGSVEGEIFRACLVLYAQSMDLTLEATEAIQRVAKELDILIQELNLAASAK